MILQLYHLISVEEYLILTIKISECTVAFFLKMKAILKNSLSENNTV